LPLDTLASFACRELSRHFVTRNDYGLFEFAAYIYAPASNQHLLIARSVADRLACGRRCNSWCDLLWFVTMRVDSNCPSCG